MNLPEGQENTTAVCKLSVRNIPDEMRAWELYNILTALNDFQVISIKIRSEKTQKGQDNGNQPERLLNELLNHTPKSIFRMDTSVNETTKIQSFLDELQSKGSLKELTFCKQKEYTLGEVPKRLTKLKKANYMSPEDQKIQEIDLFLSQLRNTYVQKKQNSYQAGSKPALPGFNLLEAFTKGSNDGIEFGVGKGESNLLSTNEKKSANVVVIGEINCLRSLYLNKEIRYRNTHPIYIHFTGLEAGMSPANIAKNKRFYLHKKSIMCQNLELGFFGPIHEDNFCSYWDTQLIKKQNDGVTLSYFWTDEQKKSSKKVEIMFEVPKFESFIKIEFAFNATERICIEKEGENITKSIYFETSYSPRFRMMKYNDNEYFNPFYNESWERIPNFALSPVGDQLLNMHLTQFIVIKLAFSTEMNQELEKFLERIEQAGTEVEKHHQVLSYSVLDAKLPYLTMERLNGSKLSYETKYGLLAALSQKKVDLYRITSEVLTEFEKVDEAVLEKTLKDISCRDWKAKSSEKEKLKKSFSEIFWAIYEENKTSKELWSKKKLSFEMMKTKRISVTPTKIIYYTEEAEISNTVLRKYKDEANNFLRLTFSDETGEAIKNMKYISKTRFEGLIKELKILKKGYKFLAFSSSQLRNNSLWMFSETPDLTVESIHKKIGDLGDIKNPAKYAARLGQLLSASLPALKIDLTKIKVEVHDDVTVKDEKGEIKYTFSDGIGKISTNLIDQIKINLKIKGVVSAIQIRYGEMKGVLVGDPTLADNTIIFRRSMQKFKDSSFNYSLELLDYSKYRAGYLNRQIIMLLLTNKVLPEVLNTLQIDNIQDLLKIDNLDTNLFRYVNNDHHLSPTRDLLQGCFEANVDVQKEPFVRGILETIRVRSFINLKEKCNILVKDAARLTGVLDEYSLLKPGQIYVCISESNGVKKEDYRVIAGRVIVTKNPCLHPGDIRILEAMNTVEICKRFGHLVNCVVFPAIGTRPHTDEIAGSDLDGDQYFVSWDQRLIPRRVAEPMNYVAKKRIEQEVSNEAIINFFVEYTNNDVLGKIDNSHLAFADQDSEKFARNPFCQELAELHSDAVDYAKSGVCPSVKYLTFAKLWPDYMGKDFELSYESKNILGELFRDIKFEIENRGIKDIYKKGLKISSDEIQIDEDMIYDGFENHLGKSLEILKEFYKDLRALMEFFSIQTEYEVFSGNFLKLMVKGKKYNLEKLQESVVNQIQALQDKFLEVILEEFNDESEVNDESGNFLPIILEKASALYIASYYNQNCQIENVNAAMMKINYKESFEPFFATFDVQFIGFPWYVFKEALFQIKKENLKNKLQLEEEFEEK